MKDVLERLKINQNNIKKFILDLIGVVSGFTNWVIRYLGNLLLLVLLLYGVWAAQLQVEYSSM